MHEYLGVRSKSRFTPRRQILLLLSNLALPGSSALCGYHSAHACAVELACMLRACTGTYIDIEGNPSRSETSEFQYVLDFEPGMLRARSSGRGQC